MYICVSIFDCLFICDFVNNPTVFFLQYISDGQLTGFSVKSRYKPAAVIESANNKSPRLSQ